MTGEQFNDQLLFEKSLGLGDPVEIRWTNSYNFFRANALVKKINTSSLLAELTVPVHFPGGNYVYPIGHVIKVPRLTLNSKWSVNNGVFQREKFPLTFSLEDAAQDNSEVKRAIKLGKTVFCDTDGMQIVRIDDVKYEDGKFFVQSHQTSLWIEKPANTTIDLP